jgi:hypothetical protein
MEPSPLSHRANKCWGRIEGGGTHLQFPKAMDAWKLTHMKYGIWCWLWDARPSTNEPPFDTHDYMHTCTSLHVSSGIFLVLISLLDNRTLFLRVCALQFPFTPSAARQPHIATTITIQCSDSVKANAIHFLSRALVFHKARAVVASWVSNTNTTAPPTKNFSKHLSPQHILRAENIPTKQPAFHPHTSPLLHTQTSHKHQA